MSTDKGSTLRQKERKKKGIFGAFEEKYKIIKPNNFIKTSWQIRIL